MQWYFGLGLGVLLLVLFCYSLLCFSSLAQLLTLCQLRSCLRHFSSTLSEQSSFRSCFTQYAGRCIPSRWRFHFRLIATVQGIEDNIQRDTDRPVARCFKACVFAFWSSGAHVFVVLTAERARRACQGVSVVYATEFAYYAIHARLCDARRCSCTVQALTLHQRHFQRQRRASDAPDSAISTSHILHGVVRITNGVQCVTWPEFCCPTFGSVLRTSFSIPWWLRVLPKELDEKVAKLQFSRTQYGVGNSVVHKLMDAMSSALKLRGAGLTPHFHAERSSNLSMSGRLELRTREMRTWAFCQVVESDPLVFSAWR